MIVFAMGLAAFFAALQVYFRDTSSFLPFFVRIWMYLSPILWAPEHIIGRFSGPIMTLIQLNPMYSMIGGYTELLQNDAFPTPYMWISAAVWALAAAVIGFLYFISRSVSLLSVLSNGEVAVAVKVNDLSVTYRTTFERKPTLKQALVRFGRGQRAVREEAIKNVSFEVRNGTSMGIIGSNGAGKSTLMRAMAGIPPTSGSIEVWGRASTLLALGVGFNQNLSGRENIIPEGWPLACPAGGGGAPSMSPSGPSLAISLTCRCGRTPRACPRA